MKTHSLSLVPSFRLISYLVIGLLLLALLPSCKNAYTITNFDEVTQDHRSVAVLPFEMVFMGITPKNLTEEDIQQIEEAESQAFQISFHNEILRSTRNGRGPIRIDLQPYSTTLAKLDKNNISIRESWQTDPTELAKLLGVDAVVKGRIEKTQYLPDLASFGIDIGLQVLRTIQVPGGIFIPNRVTNSKEVYGVYNLIDQSGERVLWSVSCDIDADWSQQSNEIIDRVNRRSARRFPYRL